MRQILMFSSPWFWTALGAATLLVVDAWVFNQGLFAVLTLLFLLLWRLPKLAWVAYRRRPWRTGLLQAAVWALAALAVLLANHWNNQHAQRQATALIAQIERYRLEQGHYPQQLTDLVPRYVAEVPAAKWTLSHNLFIYRRGGENGPWLIYIELPPFGRKVYRFQSHDWHSLD